MFSNNNFQFLNTCTKRAPNLSFLEGEISTKKKKKRQQTRNEDERSETMGNQSPRESDSIIKCKFQHD